MWIVTEPEEPMKTRLLIAVPALLAVVALAGVLAPGPNPAAAQEPAAPENDTVTVTGVGSVESVPDEATFSFGVDSRGRTAQAAIAANAEAMESLIAAVRRAGAREIATQWVSVYAVTDESGQVTGYAASNSVSATIGVGRAGALIDAAAEAGANQISGPGMSSSDADRLYRDALAGAVADARQRAEVLARAAGRSLGEISTLVEVGSQAIPYAAEARDATAASTPIVPGHQKTSATVSVTFSLR
jgi:uncharacterized protein